MSNRGKLEHLMDDEVTGDGWHSACCLRYLIRLDMFHLKLLHSETCLKILVGLELLDYTASDPYEYAEVLVGIDTLTLLQHNMSEGLPWLTVDAFHAFGFQELVNKLQSLLN